MLSWVMKSVTHSMSRCCQCDRHTHQGWLAPRHCHRTAQTVRKYRQISSNSRKSIVPCFVFLELAAAPDTVALHINLFSSVGAVGQHTLLGRIPMLVSHPAAYLPLGSHPSSPQTWSCASLQSGASRPQHRCHGRSLHHGPGCDQGMD
jgi:hypothetical protein